MAVVHLRRDAAANRERVLAAALAAVKREGEKVPIATIATEAGVGVATLYRSFSTREALLAALAERSYRLILRLADEAAGSNLSAIENLRQFVDQVIQHRDELVLPFHGGPVTLDQTSVQLRTRISETLESILDRGRQAGIIRSDVTATDVIIAGALLAQPLPHASDWDEVARRQLGIFLDGLAPVAASALPGQGKSRAQLELDHASAVKSRARSAARRAQDGLPSTLRRLPSPPA